MASTKTHKTAAAPAPAPAAAPTPAPLPMPTQGGSYTRQPDGTLLPDEAPRAPTEED